MEVFEFLSAAVVVLILGAGVFDLLVSRRIARGRARKNDR